MRAHPAFSAGKNRNEGAHVYTPDGTKIKMDDDERKVLMSNASPAEDMKVLRPAMALHIEHHFTDAWSTDGSKGTRKEEDGTTETVVGAGAYCGRQPIERGEYEKKEEWIARQVGAGMRSMRLPGHYEVVDAELAAVLMALEETANKPNAESRKCLIMSDCEIDGSERMTTCAQNRKETSRSRRKAAPRGEVQEVRLHTVNN